MKKKENERQKSTSKISKTLKLDKERQTPRKKVLTMKKMFERTQKEDEHTKTEKESRIRRIIEKFENRGTHMDTDRKKTLKRKFSMKDTDKETENKDIEKNTLTLGKKAILKFGSTTKDMVEGAEKKDSGTSERLSLTERKTMTTVKKDGIDESVNSKWKEKNKWRKKERKTFKFKVLKCCPTELLIVLLV